MSVRLIDADAYRRALSVRDLTDAALGPLMHYNCSSTDTVAALHARWRCPIVLYRSPPLVSVADNYDELGYPPDGASRDARYTRYVTHDHLLRTQMSALIPGALKTLVPADYDDVLHGVLRVSRTGAMRSIGCTLGSLTSSTCGD